MEKKTRKRYTIEYKQDVVRMLEEKGMSVAAVANDMGVSTELVYAWKRKYGKGKGGSELQAAQNAIKKLQKRLAEVEEERNILKKAVTIFTQPSKSGITS